MAWICSSQHFLSAHFTAFRLSPFLSQHALRWIVTRVAEDLPGVDQDIIRARASSKLLKARDQWRKNQKTSAAQKRAALIAGRRRSRKARLYEARDKAYVVVVEKDMAAREALDLHVRGERPLSEQELSQRNKDVVSSTELDAMKALVSSNLLMSSEESGEETEEPQDPDTELEERKESDKKKRKVLLKCDHFRTPAGDRAAAMLDAHMPRGGLGAATLPRRHKNPAPPPSTKTTTEANVLALLRSDQDLSLVVDWDLLTMYVRRNNPDYNLPTLGVALALKPGRRGRTHRFSRQPATSTPPSSHTPSPSHSLAQLSLHNSDTRVRSALSFQPSLSSAATEVLSPVLQATWEGPLRSFCVIKLRLMSSCIVCFNQHDNWMRTIDLTDDFSRRYGQLQQPSAGGLQLTEWSVELTWLSGMKFSSSTATLNVSLEASLVLLQIKCAHAGAPWTILVEPDQLCWNADNEVHSRQTYQRPTERSFERTLMFSVTSFLVCSSR